MRLAGRSAHHPKRNGRHHYLRDRDRVRVMRSGTELHAASLVRFACLHASRMHTAQHCTGLRPEQPQLADTQACMTIQEGGQASGRHHSGGAASARRPGVWGREPPAAGARGPAYVRGPCAARAQVPRHAGRAPGERLQVAGAPAVLDDDALRRGHARVVVVRAQPALVLPPSTRRLAGSCWTQPALPGPGETAGTRLPERPPTCRLQAAKRTRVWRRVPRSAPLLCCRPGASCRAARPPRAQEPLAPGRRGLSDPDPPGARPQVRGDHLGVVAGERVHDAARARTLPPAHSRGAWAGSAALRN